MDLKRFQVQKFRNIVDSGSIEMDQSVTCLVGKNESGKSALIEALYLFNPAYGEQFDVDDQYPRWLVVQDRRHGDLNEHAPICATFLLDEHDAQIISNDLGERVLTGLEIEISKRYDGHKIWSIPHDSTSAVQNLIDSLPTTVKAYLQGVEDLDELCDRLSALAPEDDRSEGPTQEHIDSAKNLLRNSGLDRLTVGQRIESLLDVRVPRFFRFTNYSTLPGRIDFRKLSVSEDSPPAQTDLQTARALLKLAGADISQLSNDDYEVRKAELEAVQIDLTNQVFEYWKTNPDLEVNIDVDKRIETRSNNATISNRYLDIRLRDKRTGYSNNFSQRSSGFQWFFSFLAAFSEFEGKGSNIVLLDEPALTLHGRAQAHFLRFINERLARSAPTIYTTHSPFMVEADKLDRVKIVEDSGPPVGAKATTDVLVADQDTLFPLQAALGYDIAQNLFVGPHNLVVEGTSEYIYLTEISRRCNDGGYEALDTRWRIIPAGGATNVPTFVSLVGPHLDTTVLVDSNATGMQRIQSMVSSGLLAKKRLVLANSVTSRRNADVEDIFDEIDYLNLYNRTFGTSLALNNLPKGERIVKRIESERGPFDHGKVAETLLRSHNEISFSQVTLERFASLINKINATID